MAQAILKCISSLPLEVYCLFPEFDMWYATSRSRSRASLSSESVLLAIAGLGVLSNELFQSKVLVSSFL